ncbi:hypothetical protein [Alteromonas sp.]|uniref:hypothetical protein n=1 Tax=Alteromonas sp. TaxID=232 RepID=UPI000C3B2F05|nr:hypothetical protein [Alteromonas sp.]MAI39616.1 hypothetical protein [Alteromonas sp.]|tara:strand:- start:589 stop:798 length:210 start_codon:yes stop_codon:yes gene_type:complete
MFKAIVFACVINSPNDCTQFDDTWGLKVTRENCETRIEEMIESLGEVLPLTGKDYKIVGTKCEKIGNAA